MLMPSIFGENLFDDDWMDFPFERFDRDFWGKKNPLYGKNAKNRQIFVSMKRDMSWILIFRDLKRTRLPWILKMVI